MANLVLRAAIATINKGKRKASRDPAATGGTTAAGQSGYRSFPRRVSPHRCHPRAALATTRRIKAFFEVFKTEMFCKRKWDGTTLDEFERSASIRCIVRYNTTRHKCSLKGVSPMEFRKALGLALAA